MERVQHMKYGHNVKPRVAWSLMKKNYCLGKSMKLDLLAVELELQLLQLGVEVKQD